VGEGRGREKNGVQSNTQIKKKRLEYTNQKKKRKKEKLKKKKEEEKKKERKNRP
jgi:hypothetical protein